MAFPENPIHIIINLELWKQFHWYEFTKFANSIDGVLLTWRQNFYGFFSHIRPHFHYTTSFCIIFSLYDLIFIIRPHFHYTTAFPKYGLYSPKFFRHQIKNWYTIKIFSLPTHPHSNHFSYKYQNFQHFYLTYMVHKPHTFHVLVKLVYGL